MIPLLESTWAMGGPKVGGELPRNRGCSHFEERMKKGVKPRVPARRGGGVEVLEGLEHTRESRSREIVEEKKAEEKSADATFPNGGLQKGNVAPQVED